MPRFTVEDPKQQEFIAPSAPEIAPLPEITESVSPRSYFESPDNIREDGKFFYYPIDAARGIYQFREASWPGNARLGAIRFEVADALEITPEEIVCYILTGDDTQSKKKRQGNIEKMEQDLTTWLAKKYNLGDRTVVIHVHENPSRRDLRADTVRDRWS